MFLKPECEIERWCGWELLRKAGAWYVMFLGLVPLETLPMYHEKEKEELASLIDDYNARLAGMKDVYFFDTNAVFKSLCIYAE